MLSIGDPAPDFTVKDHLGNDIALHDYRGKTVVLWFFPKADTPGCTAEGCGFRDVNAELAAHNALIFGISFDTPEDNKAFAEKYGFQFPLLSDTARQVALAYGAAADPTAQYAQRIGVVIGPDGTIVEYEPKVDPKTYPAEVAERIAQKG